MNVSFSSITQIKKKEYKGILIISKSIIKYIANRKLEHDDNNNKIKQQQCYIEQLYKKYIKTQYLFNSFLCYVFCHVYYMSAACVVFKYRQIIQYPSRYSTH